MTGTNFTGKKKWILVCIMLIVSLISFIELKKVYWGGLIPAVYFNPFSIFLLLAFLLLIFLFLLLVMLHFYFQRDTAERLSKSPVISIIAFILLGIFPSLFLQFSQWGNVITSAFLRILLLISVLFLMTYVLEGKRLFSFHFRYFFPALIFMAASLLLCSRLRLIVAYPFSLSWSEGNRFWDYSLLFWKDHYSPAENSIVAAFIDLGRQSLWGLAFLWKNLTIAGMRAWNTILYFVPPLVFGLLIFKHKKIKFSHLILFGLWTYAFLSEGPIYAPLIFSAILVLLAGESKNYILSLVLVLCAGFYTNLTRFTWIIAPVVWSFLLIYFREKGSSPAKRNLKSLGAAMAGLCGGIVLPNIIPIPTSSIILEENTSAGMMSTIKTIFQNQDLLWYRLFPSGTFPLGILPALFLITIPIFLILGLYIKDAKIKLEKGEKFFLIASLAGFLLIGCVVSVKIGGGSNLHNMDLFLLTILFTIYIFWQRGMAVWFMEKVKKNQWVSGLALILFLYPNLRYISSVRPLSLPSQQIVQGSLQEIQDTIDEVGAGGDILFIDQRQLLTFGEIQNVDLIGEYEKKLLMNEALSGDQAYFDALYQDLKNHRFALIIAEPVRVVYQSDENNFGEENDAYVKWVSEPLLCYYESVKTLQEVGIELLIPRQSAPSENLNCP